MYIVYLDVEISPTVTRCNEVRNSRVTKSSYETKLRKMTLYFNLLTQQFL